MDQTCELTLCILSTGSNFLLDKTIRSLEQQTCKDFRLEIVDYAVFRKTDRNITCGGSGYTMFLYNGFELSEDAVETINKAINDIPSSWYYCDERSLEAKLDPTKYDKIWENPDFDPIQFGNRPYTGMGIIFSRNALEQMHLNCTDILFYPLLLEMTIQAAKMANGVHISRCLLTRTDSKRCFKTDILDSEISDFRKQRLSQFADYTCPSLLSPSLRYASPRESISVIQAVDQNRNSQAKLFYHDQGIEYVSFRKTKDLYSCCERGAAQASGEILCFIDSSCYVPEVDDLRRMQVYAEALNIGICSPCLITRDKYAYLGVSSFAGRDFPLLRDDPLVREHREEIFNIRQTAKPAWQFWIIRKETFLQATRELPVEACHYSRENFMIALAHEVTKLGKTNLFLGNILAYVAQTNTHFSAEGASELLFKYKKRYFLDPYCPKCIRSYMRSNIIKDHAIEFPNDFDFDAGRKRMLMISHELSLTGAPLVLVNAAKILKDAGWQILVVSKDNGPVKEAFLKEGIPVAVMGNMDSEETWIPFARTFNLVFVNTVVPFHQIEKLSSETVPVMWWIHDARSGYEEYLKNVLPETIGNNIHTWCVSGYADQIVHEFRPAYKTGILHYGVQDEANRVENLHSTVIEGERRKVFVSVGTIIHRKGQDVLAKAIDLLPADILKECLFLFVGKCIDRDIYHAIENARDRHPDSIRLISAIPHDEIFALYKDACAVICSSRDDPLPTFISETMMVSGVCICSSNTGTAPVIQHGINGFVYHNDDPQELAACIEKVERCKDLQIVKQAGRRTYEEQFSMDTFRENLLSCVELCLKGEALE